MQTFTHTHEETHKHIHTHKDFYSAEYWASPISLKTANETTVLCYCSISHPLDINRKSGVRCIRQTVPMMRDYSHKTSHTGSAVFEKEKQGARNKAEFVTDVFSLN